MKMRKLLAGVLVSLLAIPMAFAETFDDVSNSHENYVAIEYLVSIGTLEGYGDGTFQPDRTINRAELMKVLVAGQGISPDETVYKDCYPDVTDDWYAKYVCYATEHDWVGGYPDGTFLPAQTVNKVEAVKMLVNALGLDSMLPESVEEDLFDDTDSDAWYASYVYVAKDLNLLEVSSGNYDPSGEMNRAGVAEYIFRTLVVQDLDVDAFDEDAQTEFLTEKGLTDLINDENVDASGDSKYIPNIVLEGEGDSVTEAFTLEEGLSLIRFYNLGDSNFIVKALSSDGEDTEYLVNEIGPETGTTAFQVEEGKEYVLDVTSDGYWVITIEQPRDTSSAEVVKSFSGEGQVVTDFFVAEEGLAVFDFTHDGDSNFIVQLLDENGDTEAYLANSIGNYEGSVAEYVDEGIYVLLINADGDWTIDFDQVDFSEASNELSFSGTGDAATNVFVLDGGLTTFSFTHEGSSNFIVEIRNDEGRLEAYLVNGIGDYEGETAEQLDAGYYIINVQADGDWTIEIE